MSYTKSFESTVEVSGTVSASYPASEHGGHHSVSYSQTVPVTINIHVDTDPFESSVGTANLSVDSLTNSVTILKDSQCRAIDESSKKIAESLVQGFYHVINSEMSMNKEENNSTLQANAALILQFSKDIATKHTRMQSDLERLSAYYSTLFHGLDEDLAKRINSLDRSAFYLSDEIHKQLISNSYMAEGAFGITQIGNTNTSVEKISIARIRKKISDVLSTMTDYVMKSINFKKTITDVEWNQNNEQETIEYIPTVYIQMQDISKQDKSQVQCFVPNMNGKDLVRTRVEEYFNHINEDEWKNVPEDKIKQIDQFFMNLVEENLKKEESTSTNKERVYREMLTLWNNSKQKIEEYQ